MKIWYSESSHIISAIERHLVLEGDETVSSRELADIIFCGKGLRESGRVIGGDMSLPKDNIRKLGYNCFQLPVRFCLLRWFDGGFTPQILVALPMSGVLQGGLGHPAITGYATKVVQSSWADDQFLLTLEEYLAKINYLGPVQLGFSLSADGEAHLVQVELGFSDFVIFNVLESVRGRLMDYILNAADHPLHESWVVGLLLSRFPFPDDDSNLTAVGGYNRDVEKHFWPFNFDGFRDSVFCYGSAVGVATGWSFSLPEANRRAVRTCSRLEVKNKQFRSDLPASLRRSIETLKSQLGLAL